MMSANEYIWNKWNYIYHVNITNRNINHFVYFIEKKGTITSSQVLEVFEKSKAILNLFYHFGKI